MTISHFLVFVLCHSILQVGVYSCERKDSVHTCRLVGKRSGWEVVGFTGGSSSQMYKLFDWKKLTTVVVSGTSLTSSFVSYAHSKGVKVHLRLNVPSNVLNSQTSRKIFVTAQIKKLRTFCLDGINIDFERPVSKNGVTYNGLTSLMKTLRGAMRKVNARYELTMDYVYCPFCDGRRVYDILQIMRFVDYFIIMDYDLQGVAYRNERAVGSQCLSTFISNSPLPLVKKGAEEFVKAGIRADQLVMALPWYGRSNPCIKFDAAKSDCYVPCSHEYSKYALRYKTIMNILRTSSENGRVWKPRSSTPSLTHFFRGRRYQVNYDDPESLAMKWKIALSLGFRGAGVWNIDFLDYSNTAKAAVDRKAMWNAIPSQRNDDQTLYFR